MLSLNTAKESSFETIPHVAIAITLLRERDGQHHVGVLHKNETTSEVRILHLFWHNDLRNTPFKPTYAWITPPILAKRARHLAAICRAVYSANTCGIPYAFGDPTDCFDPGTLAFIPGNRWGLTCATFVLALFHTAGLPLIQYETWPHRQEGDEQWMKWIIHHLTKDANHQHIANVQQQTENAVRYRPEQVAGAAATDKVPATFKQASGLAREISAGLKTRNLYTPAREL